MISSRRLAQMAKTWLHRAAAATAAGRKRIPFNGGGATMGPPESDACTSSAPARKGCFTVYSGDGQRFEVPLTYLKSDVFVELLKLSEDVFGLPGAGPITLPCDAAVTETVISCLRRRGSSRDAEMVRLTSMAVRQCSTYVNPCSSANQQLVVCGC